MEEERAWRAAAARAYAEELEGLPLKPVSAWPAPVRTLVRQREAAAAEVCVRLVQVYPAQVCLAAMRESLPASMQPSALAGSVDKRAPRRACRRAQQLCGRRQALQKLRWRRSLRKLALLGALQRPKSEKPSLPGETMRHNFPQ